MVQLGHICDNCKTRDESVASLRFRIDSINLKYDRNFYLYFCSRLCEEEWLNNHKAS